MNRSFFTLDIMKHLILSILSVFVFTSALVGQSTDTTKVLFVGNSYTYFWNLPQHVQLMAESRNIPLIARQSTAGGANLGQHWRGDKKLTTRSKIRKGDWDAVILQDHSMRTIEAPDSMLQYGAQLDRMIDDIGAQSYVYMTWAREFNPLMQETVTQGYQKLAKEIHAKVSPVGLAWKKARTLRPDIKLFTDDGSHPSLIGTYLSACVFFEVLTGENPIGLPHRLISKDQDGEYLFLNVLSQGDATFCQWVAHDVVMGME